MPWDEQDRKYGRKVTYWVPPEPGNDGPGVRRTAYLDTWLGGDRYSGEEKHTGDPVIVDWDGERYRQV